jgi:hypothetical protein
VTSVPDPDFGGLRSAVEDAADRVPFEALRARAATRRRRRAGLVAGLAAAGAAALAMAVVLAVPRAAPAPPAVSPGPGIPTAPDPTAAVPDAQVVQTVFGATTAYALLGSCSDSGRCTYGLLASPDEGRSWARRHAPLPALTGEDGFSAELRVTGGDDLAVLDPLHQRLYASTDQGRTFATRVLRAGPAVDAVPPGLTAEPTRCGGDSCGPARVVVLDPATGRTSPLRAQPFSGLQHVEVATGDDGRIWVAGWDGDRLVSAVSDDRGRTWRALPALAGPPLRLVRLVPVPGGGAYLLAGREDAQDVLNAFSELWRAEDADPRWVRVTPPGAPASALSAVGLSDGELLLTEEGNGGAWRTSGGGTRIARDPAPTVDDLALPLGWVERSGRLLVARTATRSDAVLLVSADDGRSWERRPIAVR